MRSRDATESVYGQIFSDELCGEKKIKYFKLDLISFQFEQLVVFLRKSL